MRTIMQIWHKAFLFIVHATFIFKIESSRRLTNRILSAVSPRVKVEKSGAAISASTAEGIQLDETAVELWGLNGSGVWR